MRGRSWLLRSVRPTADEVRRPLPGDDLVPTPDVVMDRAFTIPASPVDVWPWLEQLGKGRAGWYLPHTVERLVPPSRRAARQLERRWLGLEVGDVVPDYGGPAATFTVARLDPPRALVYQSTRRRMAVSWAIHLSPVGPADTRVHLRLRLAPVRHRRLAVGFGGLFDALTIAGMRAGLMERLARS